VQVEAGWGRPFRARECRLASALIVQAGGTTTAMDSVLTFIATAVVILGTWLVVMRAAGNGAWLTVLAALAVGVILLMGLYLLVSRRGNQR
jgi:Mn2+/Fe2+ NRAMP family transporter